MKSRYYNVLIVGGTDPELFGPYKTRKARDDDAKCIWQEKARQEYDGLFRATVDSRGKLTVSPFVGGELDKHLPFGGSHAPDCPYRCGGECNCWRSDPDLNPELVEELAAEGE